MNDEIIYSGKPIFRVTEVRADDEYKLHLTFSNGEKRVYDGTQLLGNDDVFSPLENIYLFKQAKTDGCAVVWNDEIDIAPEALYEDSVPYGENNE